MGYQPQEDDSLLVKSLSKGNIPAFNTLFGKYGSRLYRFAYGYLRSTEEAEELVQEVFTTIWEKRAQLKEELSFKAFLFTIAFNLIKKNFRNRVHASEYFKTGIMEDFDIETSDRVTYNSLHQFISELVDKLSARRKEIFIKSRFEGLSIKEIAKELKISHKTVENHLTDALKFIRANLQRESISAILFFALFTF